MSKLRELIRKPKRVFFAYLAEDYDGIGQYVKVALARSSTSSAMKVRVAAGDFGGGRIFPAGTRVPVVSIRGQMEVLLGNHPRVGCIDTFSRSVVNTIDTYGLGISEIKQLPWFSLEGSAGFSVSGGKGRWTRVDDGFTSGQMVLPIYPQYPQKIEFDFEFGVVDADDNTPYYQFSIGDGELTVALYFDIDGSQWSLWADVAEFVSTNNSSASTKVVDVSIDEIITGHIVWDISSTASTVSIVTSSGSANLNLVNDWPNPFHQELEWFSIFCQDGGGVEPSTFIIDNLKFSPCDTIDQHLDDTIKAADWNVKFEFPIEFEIKFKVNMASTSVHHALELSIFGPTFEAPWFGSPTTLAGVTNSITGSAANRWVLESFFEDGNLYDTRSGYVDQNDDDPVILSTVDDVWCFLKIKYDRFSVYSKVWKEGSAEPDYQGRTTGELLNFRRYDIEVPAFGQIGIRCACNATGSEFLIEYIKITTGYDGQTDYMFDNFERSVSPGWGIPSGGIGQPYYVDPGETPGIETQLSVNGTRGRFLSTATIRQFQRWAPIDWGS